MVRSTTDRNLRHVRGAFNPQQFTFVPGAAHTYARDEPISKSWPQTGLTACGHIVLHDGGD
jgi:hypothetical protein